MTKNLDPTRVTKEQVIKYLDGQIAVVIGNTSLKNEDEAQIIHPEVFYQQVIKYDPHRFDNCTDKNTVVQQAMKGIPGVNITRDNCSSYGISISK